MSDLSVRRFGWRQLRHDAGPALMLALMVVILAGIVAAVPTTMKRLATQETQHSVDSLAAGSRNLTHTDQRSLPTGPAPAGSVIDLPAAATTVYGALAAALAQIRLQLPALVQQVTGPARFLETGSVVRLEPLEPERTPGIKLITPVVDPFVPEHLSLIEGRWAKPAAQGTIEVVIGAPSAERMGWPVGGTRRGTTSDGEKLTFALVGTAEVADPDYESMFALAVRPNYFDDGNNPVRVTAQAYVDPSVFGRLAGLSSVASYWYPVHRDGFSAANLVAAAADLRQVTAKRYRVATPGPEPLNLQLRTTLPETLDATNGRVVSASSVQTIAGLGPAVAAAAVLALGIGVFGRRRRSALALLIARGAAPRQLRALVAAQGLAIGLPAAAVGTLVVLIISGGSTPWPAIVAGVLVGFVPATTMVIGLPSIGLRAGRADLGGQRVGRRRVGMELAVVLLAALSVYLLLSGGLTAGSGGGDVLVAAAPVLMILAVCVLVIRIYPIPLLALQRLLHRRRGVVGYLGAVRSVRDPAVGVPLIVATVTGVAVAVFSVVTASTISRGTEVGAAQAVGADLRMTGAWILPEFTAKIRKAEGVRQSTSVGYGGSVTIRSADGPIAAEMYFADTATFADVQRDIPGAATVPANMSADRPDGSVPVVASMSISSRLAGAARVDSQPLTVVGSGALPIGLGARDEWILVDIAHVDELTNSSSVGSVLLVALTPGADGGEVEQRIRRLSETTPGVIPLNSAGEAAFTVTFDQPTLRITELRAVPTVGGMQLAMSVAVGLGLVLVAMAVVITAVAGTGARNRLLSVLRQLGMRRRQVAGLAAWEQAPPAAAAVIVGGAFGWGLAILIRQVVDLRSFTGGARQPAVVVAPGLLGLVLGGFLLVLALAIGVTAILANRAGAAELMRRQDMA